MKNNCACNYCCHGFFGSKKSCLCRNNCPNVKTCPEKHHCEKEDAVFLNDTEALKAIEYLRKYPPEMIEAYMRKKGYL